MTYQKTLVYAYVVLAVLSFLSAMVLFNDSFSEKKSLFEIYRKNSVITYVIDFFRYIIKQIRIATGNLPRVNLLNFLKDDKDIEVNDVNDLSEKNTELMMGELAQANLLDENGNIRKDLTPEEKAKVEAITKKYLRKQQLENNEGTSIFSLLGRDSKKTESEGDQENDESLTSTLSPEDLLKQQQEQQELEENQKKEVYNISENIFTYDQAKNVCKKYGGELATYAQVKEAHENGANWCNYGWSAGQMALYPIQQKYYDEVIKTKINDCGGEPGVNGGYFPNKNIEFGVNCYGIKPKARKENIIYETTTTPNTSSDSLNEEASVTTTRNPNLIDEVIDEINISPFNTNKWSKLSTRKSKYYKVPHEKYRAKIVDGKIKDPSNLKFDGSSCVAVGKLPKNTSKGKGEDKDTEIQESNMQKLVCGLDKTKPCDPKTCKKKITQEDLENENLIFYVKNGDGMGQTKYKPKIGEMIPYCVPKDNSGGVEEFKNKNESTNTTTTSISPTTTTILGDDEINTKKPTIVTKPNSRYHYHLPNNTMSPEELDTHFTMYHEHYTPYDKKQLEQFTNQVLTLQK